MVSCILIVRSLDMKRLLCGKYVLSFNKIKNKKNKKYENVKLKQFICSENSPSCGHFRCTWLISKYVQHLPVLKICLKNRIITPKYLYFNQCGEDLIQSPSFISLLLTFVMCGLITFTILSIRRKINFARIHHIKKVNWIRSFKVNLMILLRECKQQISGR